MNVWQRVAGATSLILLVAGPAAGTPRYSLVAGQDCNLCHVNPTGGGLRDPYATQYLLPTRLAMQLNAPDEDEALLPNPQISEDVTLGADLRTMWLYRDDADAGNNFREMQGSVYLGLTPGDPRYRLYVHQDFGQLDQAVEVWGMGYVLPANGYVKVGRFVPAFGWKVADHRSFSRRSFVFLPAFPPHSDTGVEAGVYPGRFALEVSVTNGQIGLPDRDRNDSVALAARGAWRWERDPGHLVVGGSWYRNRDPGERDAAGPFLGARYGRFVWIAELDWTRTRAVETNPVTWGFVTTQELSVRLIQGLNLAGTYDFVEPDLDFATGALHRVGVGVDALTHPFLKLSAKVNAFSLVRPEAGTVIAPALAEYESSGDFVQMQLEVHLLY